MIISAINKIKSAANITTNAISTVSSKINNPLGEAAAQILKNSIDGLMSMTYGIEPCKIARNITHFTFHGGDSKAQKSIDWSLQRLEKAHAQLPDSCEYLAKQMTDLYAFKFHSEIFNENNAFSQAGDKEEWGELESRFHFAALNLNVLFSKNIGSLSVESWDALKDSILLSIRATVLKMLANLADKHPGATDDAFGLLALSINNWLAAYPDIDLKTDISEVFVREMGDEFLKECFGEIGLELFHPFIPKPIEQAVNQIVKEEFSCLLGGLLKKTIFIRDSWNAQEELRESLRRKPLGHLYVEACKNLAEDLATQATQRIGSFMAIVDEMNTHLFEDKLSKDAKIRLACELEDAVKKSQLTYDMQLYKICDAYCPVEENFKNIRTEQLYSYQQRLCKIMLTTEKAAEVISPNAFLPSNVEYMNDVLKNVVGEKNQGLNVIFSQLTSYSETLLLKIVDGISSLNGEKLNEIQTLALKARNKIEKLEEVSRLLMEAEKEIERLADKEFVKTLFSGSQGNNIVVNKLKVKEKNEDIKLEEPEKIESDNKITIVENKLEAPEELKEDPFQDIIEEDQLEVFDLCQTKNEVIKKLLEEILTLLNIREEEKLFGFPQGLGNTLIDLLSQEAFSRWMGLEKLHAKVRTYHVGYDLNETEASVKQVVNAIEAFSKVKGADYLAQKDDDNKKIIYRDLAKFLDDFKDRYKTMAVFAKMIQKPVAIKALENHIGGFLAIADAALGFNQIHENVKTFISEKIALFLESYTTKSLDDRRKIEQSILSHLLPILSGHISHLNAVEFELELSPEEAESLKFAPKMNDEIAENKRKRQKALQEIIFLDAAKKDLHPAVVDERTFVPGMTPERIKQKHGAIEVEHFFRKHLISLIEIFIPGGKEELREILKDVAPEALEYLWGDGIDQTAASMSQLIDVLFSKDTLETIFISIFEAIERELQNEQVFLPPSKPILFSGDKEKQDAVNKMTGELVFEAARFLDIPLDKFLAKHPRFDGLKETTFQAIGEALSNQLSGRFIDNTIAITLKNLSEVKAAPNATETPFAERMKVLEKNVVKAGVGYTFRYIDQSTKYRMKSSNFLIRPFLRITWAIATFAVKVFVKIIRAVGLENWALNKAQKFIEKRRVKAFETLENGSLHRNVLYKVVDAFVDCLRA